MQKKVDSLRCKWFKWCLHTHTYSHTRRHTHRHLHKHTHTHTPTHICMTNTMHLPCWWGCDVGCCRAENRSERVPERRQAFTRSQGECRLSVLSGVPAALNCVMASLDLPRPRPPRSLGHGHQKPRCLANTSRISLSSILSPFLCHAPSF